MFLDLLKTRRYDDEANEQVVVGEVEAGRAASVKRAINKLISGVNTSTFDLGRKTV